MVITIIAILAAMLLPALARAKGAAQLTRCKSNERQMGIAMVGFVQDNAFYPGLRDGRSGTTLYWFNKLEPYAKTKWIQSLYDCPGFPLDRSKLPIPVEMQTNLNYGAYAYNFLGVPTTFVPPPGTPGLGLFIEIGEVTEAQVASPSDMVVIGDAYCESFSGLDGGLTRMTGYQIQGPDFDVRARASARQRHTGVFNVLFCDGHVLHMKPSKLFGQSDDALQRLNNDHQSHSDIVAHYDWTVIND